MDVAFPYDFTADGGTAEAPPDAHIEQMIEQILFTMPGERVNRPEFGVGLQRYVFAASPELPATLQALVHEALQRWLGHRILVEAVEVTLGDSRIAVSVGYVVAATGRGGHVILSQSG